jgi:hypothetical protein
MDIMRAFTAMLDEITAADVSPGQETGVLVWHSRAARAAVKARSMGAARQCLEVTFAGSRVHREWRTSARHILNALTAQMDEARRRRAVTEREALAEASKADAAGAAAAAAAHQASAARARAADARARAAHALRLAAMADEQYKAGFLAQADDLSAQAAAAEAAGRHAGEEHDSQAAAAERHRDRAGRLRQLARKLLQWEAEAEDARGTGENLVRGLNPAAWEYFEGIRAAGGLRNVPRSKWYLTASGAQLAATAGTGGGAL